MREKCLDCDCDLLEIEENAEYLICPSCDELYVKECVQCGADMDDNDVGYRCSECLKI